MTTICSPYNTWLSMHGKVDDQLNGVSLVSVDNVTFSGVIHVRQVIDVLKRLESMTDGLFPVRDSRSNGYPLETIPRDEINLPSRFQANFDYGDGGRVHIHTWDTKRGPEFRKLVVALNPNDATWPIYEYCLQLLDQLTQVKVTRIDLCCDVPYDLAQCRLRDSYGRFSTERRGGKKDLETIEWGATKSRKSVRFYDKQKELAKRHHKGKYQTNKSLWRVEAELRSTEINRWKKAFTGIDIIERYPIVDNLKVLTPSRYLMLRLLQVSPRESFFTPGLRKLENEIFAMSSKHDTVSKEFRRAVQDSEGRLANELALWGIKAS